MRKLTMGAVALAMAGVWAQAGDIPKEPRSRGKLTITADLDFITVARENLADFSDDRVLTSRTTGTKSNAVGATGLFGDSETATWTQLGLNFHGDLGSDAYMAVQVSANDINARSYGAQDGRATNTGSTFNGQSEFELELRQAYAHLDNFLVDRLSLRLGIQELNYGLDRGNGTHFLLATGDLGHRFQFRNGGNVDYAFNATKTGGAAAVGAVDFMHTNERANPGFGWKFSYGQEQGDTAWNVDAVWTLLEETGTDNDDEDLLGFYGTYGFEMTGKEKSLITAHFVRYADKNIVTEEDGNVGTTDRGYGSEFWGWGAGAQVRWENVEVFGEFDLQTGDFNEDAQGGSAAGIEEDQDASAWYIGGKYTFKDMMADMTPWVETSLWSYSGDDDNTDDKNEAYINYGSVKESMIVEDNQFGMGLSNNYFAWRLKGGISFDANAGPVKGEKSIEIGYHMFTVNEDTISAANSVTGAQLTEDDLGDEWDIKLRWGYSENISFSLGYAWFNPGSYISDNVQLGGIAAGGGSTQDSMDDTVTVTRFDASFRF